MRHDHTKWLVHFVRDRNPEQDFPGEEEDEAGLYISGELALDASAFEVLSTIVRLGGITPGYSFRSGKTTIYGGKPAVCATEMPLYSFAKYAQSRKDSSKVSAYGVAFLKAEFFKAGGRPAIYGLSSDTPSYKINKSTARIFDDATLPQQEQYRYVAFNPIDSTSHWIDWSHEREWRWVAQNDERHEIWQQDYNGIYDSTPGLPIFKGSLDGGPFTRVCLIVWTHDEAEQMRELLTGFYLAGSNNYSTPFDKALLARSKIIVLQDVVDAVESGKDLNAQTIEGLEEAHLLQPLAIHFPSKNEKAIVEKAMANALAVAKKAAASYIAKHPKDLGPCGFAHAVTYEVTSPLVQYLLATGNASGPFDGAVWINIQGDWPARQSIDYQEHICEAASDVLSKDLGIQVCMESRLD